MAAAPTAASFAWEEQYQRSWDVIQEDENGSLKSAIAHLKNKQIRRSARKYALPANVSHVANSGATTNNDAGIDDEAHVKRGIIRHVYIVVDASKNAQEETDFFPNRLGCFVKLMESVLIPAFFAQNCLSQMGIIVTQGGKAFKICELTGSVAALIESLASIKSMAMQSTAETQQQNHPSIHNSLLVATKSFQLFSMSGAFKEILFLYSSAYSVDPETSIAAAIASGSQSAVRISAINLIGDLFLLKGLTTATHGLYLVPLAEAHLRDAIASFVAAPVDFAGIAKSASRLMAVGFPRKQLRNAALGSFASGTVDCVCHVTASEAASASEALFVCSRCNSAVCQIPAECPVCSLLLISWTHLARSFAGLFLLEEWELAADDANRCEACSGCSAHFQGEKGDEAMHSPRFRCPRCNSLFCADCDAFCHESLQACPGCC